MKYPTQASLGRLIHYTPQEAGSCHEGDEGDVKYKTHIIIRHMKSPTQAYLGRLIHYIPQEEVGELEEGSRGTLNIRPTCVEISHSGGSVQEELTVRSLTHRRKWKGKYKTHMCRDLVNCTFAHSQEEMER